MAMIEIDGALVEHAWFHPVMRNDSELEAPIVFLHHGFGCVADWKSFPSKVADATGRSALVYSRRGCGASSALPFPRTEAYLHDEARGFLPLLLDRLGMARCHLYGHSDGATIALLFASTFPDRALASVVEAPHVFAEEMTLRGVAALNERYETDATLRRKISRFHRDPDGAFYAWSKAWLLPEFRSWTIADELASLSQPLLVIQGAVDPFGSMAHARLIADRSGRIPIVVELARCGHSPHTESEAETLQLVTKFFTDCGNEQAVGELE